MATIAYMYCIFLMTLILRTINANYCQQKNCGAEHTMCKFPTRTPSKQCGEIEFVGLTLDERGIVLKMHNMLRQRVAAGMERRGSPGPQPAARNLGPLKWDNELALIAQRWAIQCEVNNDKCRHVDRFNVAQNMAFSKTTGTRKLFVEDMVLVWYDEVRLFDRKQVDSLTTLRTKKGEKLNHYVQMMWAKTKFVGCGAIRYKHGRERKMLLVCNYGPAGKRQGEPVYQRL